MLHLKPKRVFNYMHFSKHICGKNMSKHNSKRKYVFCMNLSCQCAVFDVLSLFGITFFHLSHSLRNITWFLSTNFLFWFCLPWTLRLSSECVFTSNKMIGSETESGTCSIRSALVDYAGPVLQPAVRSLITEQVMPLSLPLSYRRWHRASTPLSQPLA